MNREEAALYLIPVPLGEEAPINTASPRVIEVIYTIEVFVAERIRTARRHIRKMVPEKEMNILHFFELNKNTDETQIEGFLSPITRGKSLGLLAESGAPAIADPGAKLIASAHRKGIRVIPLAGPSAILLALMSSGMNGQKFTFNGYLPIHERERRQAVRILESRSSQKHTTEIFIETPFRNVALFEAILRNCKPATRLCIASDISLPTEQIQTLPISEWRKNRPNLHKRPSVFCLYST